MLEKWSFKSTSLRNNIDADLLPRFLKHKNKTIAERAENTSLARRNSLIFLHKAVRIAFRCLLKCRITQGYFLVKGRHLRSIF